MSSRLSARRCKRRIERHVELRAHDPTKAAFRANMRFQSFVHELRELVRAYSGDDRVTPFADRLREMEHEFQVSGELALADLLRAEAVDVIAATFDPRLAQLTMRYKLS